MTTDLGSNINSTAAEFSPSYFEDEAGNDLYVVRAGLKPGDEVATQGAFLIDSQAQLAGTLSGGEQQMLTVVRTLMGNPRVILVDEPTEGLMPAMIARI